MAIPKNDVEVIEELKRLINVNKTIVDRMNELGKDRRYPSKDLEMCRSLAEISEAWIESLSEIVEGVGTIAMYRKDAIVEDIVKALAK